jgi:hypothetical protein
MKTLDEAFARPYWWMGRLAVARCEMGLLHAVLHMKMQMFISDEGSV